jgi:hypothetical protein
MVGSRDTSTAMDFVDDLKQWKSHHANEHAAVYAAHQCIFKEDIEPRLRGRAPHHVSKFRAHSSDAQDEHGYGRWRHEAALRSELCCGYARSFRGARSRMDRCCLKNWYKKEEAMKKADEYLARARECEEKAEACHDPDARRAFKEVAQHWRQMASQADRLGQWLGFSPSKSN